MALTKIQANIVDKMADVSLQQLQIMEKYNSIVAWYQNEGMGQITDGDIQGLPEFAHVTASELQAAKLSMDALVTALGNYAANSNSLKLSKITKNLP